MLFIFTANKIYFEKWPLFGDLYKSIRNCGICIIASRLQSGFLKRKMKVLNMLVAVGDVCCVLIYSDC